MTPARPHGPKGPTSDGPARPARPRPTGPELKVYGVNACKALWQGRAADIVRVYVTKERSKEFGPLLKWCASQKKAYHVLHDDEMERVAQSVHHEGVVILAKEPKRFDDAGLAKRLETLPEVCSLLFLDGVGNPHNVGSMLRVAAHFGAPLALGPEKATPRLTPSAARMAEGGMEHVSLVGLKDVRRSLALCKEHGFQIVAAAGDGEHDLYRTALGPRVIFAVGNELHGLSPGAREVADRVVRIPGTGAVESLNVAMAASLCLGEFYRQHHARRV